VPASSRDEIETLLLVNAVSNCDATPGRATNGVGGSPGVRQADALGFASIFRVCRRCRLGCTVVRARGRGGWQSVSLDCARPSSSGNARCIVDQPRLEHSKRRISLP
jgi:hypothetical protein